MHREHPEFIIDKTKNLALWRYMEFWKFLDLLETSELYFPSVENLGDQHEGRIPEKVYQMMLEYDLQQGRKNNFAQNYKDYIENNLRSKTLVSSWNASENESFAMWKMYGKEKLGVAIKTDFNRLKNSFNNTDRNIYIGEIQYYDDNNPRYKTGNTFYTFLVKHHYYKFESEVRCLTEFQPDENINHRIKVDLNKLIKEVYISPFASENGFHSILEFLKEKHYLNFEIKISGVNDTWI